MKPGPTNRNVPSWMWDSAVRKHNAYLEYRDTLMQLGLNDEQADQYLDAHDRLESVIEYLHPREMDFRVTDHSGQFARAETAFLKIKELLAVMGLLGFRQG